MAGFRDYLRTVKNEFFDDSKNDDYDEDVVKILKVAVEDNKEEVMGFLQHLAQHNHKIQDALEELRQQKNNDMADFGRKARNFMPPHSMRNRPGHEIVPSAADSVTGDGSGAGN